MSCLTPTGAVAFEGRYGVSGASDLLLDVKRLRGDRVELDLGASGCIGNFQGRAQVSGDVMTVSDSQCRITLKRTPTGIDVKQGPGCSVYHGARCQFSATWVRRGAPRARQRAAGEPMELGPQAGGSRGPVAAEEPRHIATRPRLTSGDRYPWINPAGANWRSLGVVALHLVSDEANTVFGGIACRNGQISLIRGGHGGEPESGPTSFEIDGRRVAITGRVEPMINARAGAPGIRAAINRETLFAMRDANTIRITGVASSGDSLRRVWPQVAAACGV